MSRCHDPSTGNKLEWNAHVNPEYVSRQGPGWQFEGRVQIIPSIVMAPKGRPSFSRPDCGNVPNLAVHNPLGKCKRRDGDSMAWQQGAHRVFVERGFGMPMIFNSSKSVLESCR